MRPLLQVAIVVLLITVLFAEVQVRLSAGKREGKRDGHALLRRAGDSGDCVALAKSR
jgi:hypothetical protein